MYCMECRKYVGLTLTWDVLKSQERLTKIHWIGPINFNMGCFEMIIPYGNAMKSDWINFNMGCFEIRLNLKYQGKSMLINFNMGCFEMSIFPSHQ